MDKKQWQQTGTRFLILATLAVWIGWDLIAYIYGGNPATESANIFVFGYFYPVIPLAWGFLTGHFFAQSRLPSDKSVSNGRPWFLSAAPVGAILCSAGWLFWDIFWFPSPITKLVMNIPGPGHGSLEMVMLGTLIGYLVFKMNLPTEAGVKNGG